MKWRKADPLIAPEDRGEPIVILLQHWKKNGWLSVELSAGELWVFPEQPWCICNNDDVGQGLQRYYPHNAESIYNGCFETFKYWCYSSEIELPEECFENCSYKRKE